ncbi:MAG TPA: ParB/RepB/Spo0J family partition protein [Rhodothermales bacterium]|jgi:ParB/RepB/Spo0J family partition protein
MNPSDPSHVSASAAKLQQIPLKQISRNPDNPRILFRQQEMDELLDSIQRWGVQVPIAVYKKGRGYVLIDGERRWRCCMKLNLEAIPALVQEEPDRLTNILLMFNIHGLREQWDLLTIALKLREIIALIEEETGQAPTEGELSDKAGLKRGVIRRCRLLLALPSRYHEMILKELSKPKSQQVLTEDFFIEMERALTTVERAMPEVIPNRDAVRRVLISKFRDKIIDNRVHFRKIAKIARARNVEGNVSSATQALERLFERNDYSIEQAFEDSVSGAYHERDMLTRINSLIDRLRGIDPRSLDDELLEALRELERVAERLTGGGPR